MKLSKKNKTLLSSSIGLLAATSVVAPLAMMTSCSKNENSLEEIADKEYGVTEETFKDLKDQFISKYKANLEIEYGKDSPKVIKHLHELEKDLSSFDEVKKQKRCGFTSLTSSLIDFAKNQSDARGKKYNVKLARKTKATWAQIDALFNGWKGSFRQYMLNSDMPASVITRVMQDAQNKFVALKKELQQTCNDACDGMIQAKTKLITCFEDVNDAIGLISAALQLKEFMSQYSFTAKASIEHPEACLNRLTDEIHPSVPDFRVGNVLCDDTMNTIFYFTRKEDGKTIPFTSTLIKGYTILPRLVSFASNKITNEHGMCFDFGLVKTSYIGRYNKEKLATLTAHLYSTNSETNQAILDSDDITLDTAINKLAIQPVYFQTYLTNDAEKQALSDTYFDCAKSETGECIKLCFDDEHAENQAYEAFFDNAKQVEGNHWTSSLTSNSLINAGLMISGNNGSSYKLVKTVANEMQERIDKKLENTKANIDLTLNLSDTFLQNCEIHSITDIDDSKQRVMNTFYVSYKNSIYGKHDIENERFKLPSSLFKNPKEGYQTSKQFYLSINNKFNSVVDYIERVDADAVKEIYGSKSNSLERQEHILELRETSIVQLLLASVAITASLINAAHIIFNIWAPWKKTPSSGKKMIVWTVSLLFLLAILGGQGALYYLFLDKYFIPLTKFLKEQEEKKDDIKEKCKDMFSNLTNLGQTTFFRISEEMPFDESIYNSRKANFDKLTMSEKLRLYRVFSAKEDYKDELVGMNKFEEILSDTSQEDWEGVTGDDFKTKFDDFNVGGKYWYISLSLSVLTAILTIFYSIWVKKSTQQNPAVEPEPDLPIDLPADVALPINESQEQQLLQDEVEQIAKEEKKKHFQKSEDVIYELKEEIYSAAKETDLNELSSQTWLKKQILENVFEPTLNRSRLWEDIFNEAYAKAIDKIWGDDEKPTGRDDFNRDVAEQKEEILLEMGNPEEQGSQSCAIMDYLYELFNL